MVYARGILSWKMVASASIMFLIPMGLTGCSQHNANPDDSESKIECSLTENPEPRQAGLEDLTPQDQFLLVEQAVDSWMYFHLLDYSSYVPLIRNTDYAPRREVHIHHVRYRAANAMGGLETHEKTFEVRLKITPDGLKDFDVKDITGSPNPTETPQ